MRNISALTGLVFLLTVTVCHAQQGKNGAKVISTTNVIVNETTSLTTNAIAGNTSITVLNSTINSNNRFPASLAQGDLIMIIQMQGALIDSVSEDSIWGAITNYNNCGWYEFSEVASVPNGNAINLNCALKNNYSASGGTQVVRVPRYSSLTINSGGSLTGDAWNGSTGGVVIAEVQNNTTINTGGSIIATGIGFRGGLAQNTAGNTNNTGYASESNMVGGAKGEGIAGYETAYNAYGGMFGRGAPANGGGGGDQWNASGGGGGNGGNINNYTGDGNPDITTDTSWIAAWNLEYNGFAYSTSSGGGRGGYSIEWFPTGTPSPLVYAPGNLVWGDDGDDNQRNRENVGGMGGRPLDYSTGRIFAGGGGGAGHEDQGLGGSGGNGGGIIYLLSYGTVSGSGSIVTNGQNGGADNSTGNLGDGCGGAGAGGTAIVYSTGGITGISITASGGNGGNQYISSSYENEGPGGGGGGGYIATSTNVSGVSTTINGGVNGTTNSPLMTLFPPDGATIGGNGIIAQINSVPFSTVIANVSKGISICLGGTAQLSASGGNTYFWSPQTYLSCDTCSNPVASPVVTTTYNVTVSSGSCFGTDSVVVTISNAAAAGIISSTFNPICEGDTAELTLSGSAGTLQWQFSSTGSNFVNIPGKDSAEYSIQTSQTAYYRVWADSGLCSDTSLPYLLVVNPAPAPPILSTNDSIVCSPGPAIINSSGTYARYRWNNGDTASYIQTSTTGKYWLTVADTNGCTAISGRQSISILPSPPTPTLSTVDTIFCASDSTKIYVVGLYTSYLWSNGDSSSYITVNNAGNYWVTITNANGCSAVSKPLSISVYPVPSVSVVVQGNILTSFNSNNYQWFYNDTPITGATQPVYVAKQSGEYALRVVDSNGCYTLSNDVEVMVSGLTEFTYNNAVNIYPNPASNKLFIEVTNAGLLIPEIELLDMTGRMVLRSETISNTISPFGMDISALPNGVYLLKIKTGETEFSYPVIKQ